MASKTFLQEQIDSLISQHGIRAIWRALATSCANIASGYGNRAHYVQPIWSGFSANCLAMARMCQPLDRDDPQENDDGL
jgi:hypothetical protein